MQALLIIRFILFYSIQNVIARIEYPETDKESLDAKPGKILLLSPRLQPVQHDIPPSAANSDIIEEPNNLSVHEATTYLGRWKRHITKVRRIRKLRRLRRRHRESLNDVDAADMKAAEQIFRELESQNNGPLPPAQDDHFIEIPTVNAPAGVHPPALPQFDEIKPPPEPFALTKSTAPPPIGPPSTVGETEVEAATTSNEIGIETIDQASNYGGEVIEEAATTTEPFIEPSTEPTPAYTTEFITEAIPYVSSTDAPSYSPEPILPPVTTPGTYSESEFDMPNEAPRARPIYGFGPYVRPPPSTYTQSQIQPTYPVQNPSVYPQPLPQIAYSQAISQPTYQGQQVSRPFTDYNSPTYGSIMRRRRLQRRH